MIFETEAIVLKEVTMVDNRKLLTLLTKTKGKIVAGTSNFIKTKNKTNNAIKPFNLSKLQIYKKRDSYTINTGDVIKSYYKIGEDIEKYMNVSYVLELTEKTLVEEEVVVKVFNLLTDLLASIEARNKNKHTLIIAYEIKLLKELGYAIETKNCVLCGSEENLKFFSVENGGAVCSKCLADIEDEEKERLIEDEELGIIKIIDFFMKEPFRSFEKIGLDKDRTKVMRKILDNFIVNHLEIDNIKSREFLLL